MQVLNGIIPQVSKLNFLPKKTPHVADDCNVLLFQLPWIGDFVMESGWAQEMVKTLTKVKRDGLESSVTSAYEDLLCTIIRGSGNVVNEDLLKNGIIEICHIHKMKDLAVLISTSKRPKS